MRLCLLRQHLHQVNVANIESNRTQHAEQEDYSDHHAQTVREHQPSVQKLLTGHANPEHSLPASLICDAWQP